MEYANISFYEDTYLEEREALMTSANFPYFAGKASRIINQFTHGNIDVHGRIRGDVKMCCCGLAEYLFRAEQEQRSIAANIKSETVGKQSVAYMDPQTMRTYHEKEQRRIVYGYLANTGLLYGGG